MAAPRVARAEQKPIRIDYRAHPGCPSEAVLVEEITWRTALVRLATAGEAALEVQARIGRRGGQSRAKLRIGHGKSSITREISGTSCDEVVGALGLVTALALDPRASTGKKPPPALSPPPPPAPRAPPGPLPPLPAPRTWQPPVEPDLVADPLPAWPIAIPRVPSRWKVGARATIAVEPAPRPLLGGALLLQRVLSPDLTASIRLAAEAATTGSFDIGPGGAAFLRVVGRVDGCAFALRPTARVSIVPCVMAEAGALRGSGVLQGALRTVQVATVPWVAMGLLPEVAVRLGRVSIEAQAGPVFPLMRRQFVFEAPDYVVHEVPPLTFAASLGVSVSFP
jgi:hypothetical protein